MTSEAGLEPIAVGQNIWMRRVIRYDPVGDPFDFTVIGETKTLWRVRRTCYSEEEFKPFTIKKDGSEWAQLSEDDAKRIAWLRKHAFRLAEHIEKLSRRSDNAEDMRDRYELLLKVAAIVGYKETSE